MSLYGTTRRHGHFNHEYVAIYKPTLVISGASSNITLFFLVLKGFRPGCYQAWSENALKMGADFFCNPQWEAQILDNINCTTGKPEKKKPLLTKEVKDHRINQNMLIQTPKWISAEVLSWRIYKFTHSVSQPHYQTNKEQAALLICDEVFYIDCHYL